MSLIYEQNFAAYFMPIIYNGVENTNKITNTVAQEIKTGFSNVLKQVNNNSAPSNSKQVSNRVRNGQNAERREKYQQTKEENKKEKRIGEFLEYYYVIDKESFITSEELANNYTKWMSENYPKEPVNENSSTMSRYINDTINKDKMFNFEKRVDGKKKRGFRFRLREEEEEMNIHISPSASRSNSPSIIPLNNVMSTNSEVPLVPNSLGKEEASEEDLGENAEDRVEGIIGHFIDDVYTDEDAGSRPLKKIYNDFSDWAKRNKVQKIEINAFEKFLKSTAVEKNRNGTYRLTLK